MRVFVAGASGVIGRRLLPLLVEAGHEVTAMTRPPEKRGLLEDRGTLPTRTMWWRVRARNSAGASGWTGRALLRGQELEGELRARDVSGEGLDDPSMLLPCRAN